MSNVINETFTVRLPSVNSSASRRMAVRLGRKPAHSSITWAFWNNYTETKKQLFDISLKPTTTLYHRNTSALTDVLDLTQNCKNLSTRVHGLLFGTFTDSLFTTDTYRHLRHISPVLRQLHWLPVRQLTRYKLTTMVHRALSRQAPDYLIDNWQLVANSSRQTLQSSRSCLFTVPRSNSKFGQWSFCVAGPQLKRLVE